MATYENGDPIITIMPIAVFLDHRLTLIQTRILGAIFSFRNKDTGIATVKRETLSKRCGYSPRTISEATTQLENFGWLVKTGKGGFSKASEFRITVPDLGTVPEERTVPDPTSTTVPDPALKTVPDPGTRKEQSINKVEQSIKNPPQKATRLPTDWEPPHDFIQWAIDSLGWTPAKAYEVSDTFSDYWKAKSGKDATKHDWLATWRNWCRRENSNGAKRNAPHQQSSETRHERTIRKLNEWEARRRADTDAERRAFQAPMAKVI